MELQRQVLDAMNCVLYEQLKYKGNELDYYNSLNSYIHQVCVWLTKTRKLQGLRRSVCGGYLSKCSRANNSLWRTICCKVNRMSSFSVYSVKLVYFHLWNQTLGVCVFSWHPTCFYPIFIPQVLIRRTGIPISLSVLYLTIARQLGVKLEPVNFPSHFLLRWCQGKEG